MRKKDGQVPWRNPNLPAQEGEEPVETPEGMHRDGAEVDLAVAVEVDDVKGCGFNGRHLLPTNWINELTAGFGTFLDEQGTGTGLEG